MSMFKRKIGGKPVPKENLPEDRAEEVHETRDSENGIPGRENLVEKAGEIAGWVLMGLLLGLLGKIILNIALP